MGRHIMAIILVFGLIFSSVGAMAETVTIRIGSHTPPKSSHVSKGLVPWCRAVEKDSGGTLKFQEFWGGQLSRSPVKQYEIMMNGIQDATPVLPSYTQELFPDFSLFSLPYLFRNATEGSIAMWRMYEKGLLGGLGDVYVAAIYNNGNSLLHLSKHIETADEVRGLKIRVAGPEESAVVEAMGAIPVAMSITQVAESLNRGVIQGALSGWPAAKSFRFMPLVKTHYEEALGVRSFFLGINKKVYDNLPEQGKKAIDKNSGLVMSRKMGEIFDEEIEVLRQRAVDDPKRNIVTVSEKESEIRFATIFKPFHEEWIANNPDGKKKYDALMKILADIRQGR